MKQRDSGYFSSFIIKGMMRLQFEVNESPGGTIEMENKWGSLIVDLQGTELQPEERELLAHPLVGGLILFSRNYQSSEQLQALIQTIRGALKKPFLIMVDQEGGRVQRFRQGFTRIPEAAFYGRMYDENPERGLRLAETGAWVMAYELLSYGVDLSLAPILDLNKGLSSVIGDRAFHQDKAVALLLADAYVQGMKTAGMASTGKHFPGHGSVTLDSHQELPVDLRTFESVLQDDLQIFIHFIMAKIPALMTAHILFPEIDNLPVSFSSYWLQEVLRKQLCFEGVVISDDLDMKGADGVGDYTDRVRLAREAGCDLVLLCNNRKAVIQVLDHLPAAPYQLAISKYELLRGHFPPLSFQFTENPQWQKKRDFLLKQCELARME